VIDQRRRPLAVVTGTVAVITLLAIGCTREPEPSPPPSSPVATTPGSGLNGTTIPSGAGEPSNAPAGLRFGLENEPGSLDPVSHVFDRSTFQVARAVFDPLMAYDERLDLQPVLAESVTASEDLRTWTMKVRPGVRFHDNRPFDAAVVADMLDRARGSQTFARDLSLIANVEAVERHTVVVQMREPWSTFPHVLAGQLGMVAVAPRGDAGTAPTADIMVGTGPFRLDAWERGRHLRVVRSPDYWRGIPAKSDVLTFRFVTDATARSSMVAAGELDVAQFDEPLPMASGAAAAKQGRVVLEADAEGETPELVLALATDRAPFDDPTARAALAHAIDRDALSRRVFNGQYPPAEGPFSEGSRWFGQAQWPVRDPSTAKEELARRTDPTKPLRFELMVEDSAINRRLVQELEFQLQEIGIGVSPRWVTGPELRARVADWRFVAALVPLFGGQHPDEDHVTLHSRADGVGPNSAWIDDALTKARATSDVTAQAEQFRIIQEQLASQLPFVFLVRMRDNLVAAPAVSGLAESTLPNGRPGLPQLRGTVALENIAVATAP